MPYVHHYFLFFPLLLSLMIKTKSLTQSNNQTARYIVAIFNTDTRIGKEQKTAIRIATEDFNNSAPSTLSLTVKNSGGDPFLAVSTAQQLINDQRVMAIIGPSTWKETVLVAEIGNRAGVPVLSFATPAVTPPLTSLRWPNLIRMSNNDLVQMRCIAEIVESYSWRRVIAIYEDSGYVGGDSGIVTLLSDALRSVGSEIETQYAFPALSSLANPKTVIRDELETVNKGQCKVFVLLEMPLPLAAVIFAEAKQLGMMEKGYVWITTDGVTSLLDSVNSSVISPMEGVLGLKTYFNESDPLIRGFSEKFRRSFRQEYPEEETHEPSFFALRAYDAISVIYRNLDRNPIRGETLVSTFLSSNFKGLSGEIGFKDRELENVPIFQIINVVGRSYRNVGFWTFKLGFSEKFNGPNKALGQVYWPGGPVTVPKGWATPTISRPMKIGIPNRDYQTSVTEFCIEVFKEVVQLLPYDLPHEFEMFNGSYDDLVQHVYLKTYDAAVGDITILANRSRYVEFSYPYVESGLAMLVPTKSRYIENAWIFVKPFTKSLWVATGAIFVYTSIVVWFLEHQRNPDFRGPWRRQIGTLMWFIFSTLFFAHRERVESNLARSVLVVWLFVVFVLTSSYTASLTSMLTVQQLEPPLRVNGIIGYQGDPFVLSYLEQVLYFRPSRIKRIGKIDEYPNEFSSGNIDAAILEIPYAKAFLAKYCQGYTTIGSTYRLGGFGFVFPQGSYIVNDISEAILMLEEKGKLRELEENYFSSSKCLSNNTNGDSNGSLSLGNFWGLFLFTGSTSTIVLLLFLAQLLRKFRSHIEIYEGNASPRDESIWKWMVILVQYFHRGQIHFPQMTSISSAVDTNDWSFTSSADENEHTVAENLQTSPMLVEGSTENA